MNSPASSLCVGTTLGYVYTEGPRRPEPLLSIEGIHLLMYPVTLFPLPHNALGSSRDDPLEPDSLSQGLLLGELPQRAWPVWDACRANGGQIAVKARSHRALLTKAGNLGFILSMGNH